MNSLVLKKISFGHLSVKNALICTFSKNNNLGPLILYQL